MVIEGGDDLVLVPDGPDNVTFVHGLDQPWPGSEGWEKSILVRDIAHYTDIAAMFVFGLICLGLLINAASQFEFRLKPGAEKRRRRSIMGATAAGAVAVAAAGVLLSGAVTPQRQSNMTTAEITFTNPAPPQPGDPEPQVPCKMTVEGRGALPPGYGLAIAEQHIGDQEIDFESDVTWDNLHREWTAGITFGTANTVGYRYRLMAVVMPQQWESYLVKAVNWKRNQDTWWPQSGLPPNSTEVAEVTVRQISTTGCQS